MQVGEWQHLPRPSRKEWNNLLSQITNSVLPLAHLLKCTYSPCIQPTPLRPNTTWKQATYPCPQAKPQQAPWVWLDKPLNICKYATKRGLGSCSLEPKHKGKSKGGYRGQQHRRFSDWHLNWDLHKKTSPGKSILGNQVMNVWPLIQGNLKIVKWGYYKQLGGTFNYLAKGPKSLNLMGTRLQGKM